MNRRAAILSVFFLATAVSGGPAGAATVIQAKSPGPSSATAKASGAPANDKYRQPRGIMKEILTIECDDGYFLTADYYKRDKYPRNMPGIIFIHSEGNERHEFYPLTYMTAGRSFASLAYDLRGHGETTGQKGNPPRTAKELTDADWAAMLVDLRNVVSHLAMKPEVNGGRLALVGSGVGANLAIRAAAEPWAAAIRCVIAISPGLDIHGIKALDAAVLIPANTRLYLSAGKADAGSFDAVNAVYAAAKCRKELYLIDSAARGSMLFGHGLFGKVQEWLTSSLIEPGERKAPVPWSGGRPGQAPAKKSTRPTTAGKSVQPQVPSR